MKGAERCSRINFIFFLSRDSKDANASQAAHLLLIEPLRTKNAIKDTDNFLVT
jgi:hypothetical protein